MSFSCDSCGRLVHNHTLCDRCGTAAPGADPARVARALQRDRVVEAHLGALSVVWRASSALMAIAGLWLASLAIRGQSYFAGLGGGGSVGGLIAIGSALLVILAGGVFVIAHHLGRLANWARVTAGVLSALSLAVSTLQVILLLVHPPTTMGYDYATGGFRPESHLALPILLTLPGLLWSLSVTLTLLGRRAATVCAPGYRDLIADTADVRAPIWKSPFFVLPTMLFALAAAFVGLSFLIRLTNGY